MKVLFESDGTEIDMVEEFRYLLEDISQIILQVISESKSWMPPKKRKSKCGFHKIPSTSMHPVIVPETIITMQPSGSMHSFQIASPSGIETNDPLDDVSGFLDISSTFTIPWENFSQSFTNDCKTQKIPNPADRREVIRQIVTKIREITPPPKKIFIESSHRYDKQIPNIV